MAFPVPSGDRGDRSEAATTTGPLDAERSR
jgi:hypothetical protein